MSIFEEFKNITNNQAYELAFNNRLLLRDPANPNVFLGNTQRQDFLPYLEEIVSKLPPEAQIFDFGAGGGEIVDVALKAAHSATINLEEPNHILLRQYESRIKKYQNLKVGISYQGPLEDFYQKPESVMAPYMPDKTQNLILAMHMIYHLTNLKDDRINPDHDLSNALAAMYGFLKPEGLLFLVYADQSISTTGQAGYSYFKEIGRSDISLRLKSIWESRNKLLREGGIISALRLAFPGTNPQAHSIRTASFIYGKTEDDIAAMCLTGELGESNDDAFDINKLKLCREFIENHKNEIGLSIEDRDVRQKGMVRSNQPQIITMIHRGA